MIYISDFIKRMHVNDAIFVSIITRKNKNVVLDMFKAEDINLHSTNLPT